MELRRYFFLFMFDFLCNIILNQYSMKCVLILLGTTALSICSNATNKNLRQISEEKDFTEQNFIQSIVQYFINGKTYKVKFRQPIDLITQLPSQTYDPPQPLYPVIDLYSAAIDKRQNLESSLQQSAHDTFQPQTPKISNTSYQTLINQSAPAQTKQLIGSLEDSVDLLPVTISKTAPADQPQKSSFPISRTVSPSAAQQVPLSQPEMKQPNDIRFEQLINKLTQPDKQFQAQKPQVKERAAIQTQNNQTSLLNYNSSDLSAYQQPVKQNNPDLPQIANRASSQLLNYKMQFEPQAVDVSQGQPLLPNDLYYRQLINRLRNLGNKPLPQPTQQTQNLIDKESQVDPNMHSEILAVPFDQISAISKPKIVLTQTTDQSEPSLQPNDLYYQQLIDRLRNINNPQPARAQSNQAPNQPNMIFQPSVTESDDVMLPNDLYYRQLINRLRP